MSFKFITLSVTEGLAILTLNRPEVLNSFHREMALELLQALETIHADAAIRSVLITGNGRGFCAGQDLANIVPQGMKISEADLGAIVQEQYNPILRLIRKTEKPFVCAVNGVAAGAGANLALSCDIVIASEKASFVQSFAKVGLIPDTGGTYFLPRLVGTARATAMMMLAEKITASEAVAMGMIYKALPAEAFLVEATKIAAYLATQPTFGLGLTKRLLNSSGINSLDTQLDLERDAQRACGNSADYNEGVEAFLEKREPRFIGK